MTYRNDWMSQVDVPQEVPIERIDVTTFRVPGATPLGRQKETEVPGVIPYQGDTALCVAAGDEAEE